MTDFVTDDLKIVCYHSRSLLIACEGNTNNSVSSPGRPKDINNYLSWVALSGLVNRRKVVKVPMK